jgi:hypothetical protein
LYKEEKYITGAVCALTLFSVFTDDITGKLRYSTCSINRGKGIIPGLLFANKLSI